MISNQLNFITVVSGLPRSGTSMMMQMLKAGGIPVLTDDIRKPNEDNPKGYLEFENVKNLKNDPSFLSNAEGRVVKIISELLPWLPAEHHYKIVFMERELDEVISSQRKMVLRRDGSGEGIDENLLKSLFHKHLIHIKNWITQQNNMESIYINYQQAVSEPEAVSTRLQRYLDSDLKTRQMAAVVDRKLYRQRKNHSNQ